ncbi:MAG: type II CRISPR RNA-guided endonuclease Cas9, partial [Erysipelotrichaceae bacterium]|nr:type II CRISPR RNA-guided endonuclease Cas9 [Erysipelotrichaceae bacterium]
FEFIIPYYVGPLNPDSDKAWLVRKEGRITPWNFDELVDKDASEQKFIEKLINTCTYLPGESVLPKYSLTYERFQVLNEINNIKINGRKIPVHVKQGIYNDLFMCKRKVTVRNIKDYLKANGYYDEAEIATMSGLDTTIKSSLETHIAYKRLMENKILTVDDVERIIARSTYSEDKARFISWLKKEYSFLSEEDVKYISGIKAKDFGRLSKKFLTNFQGVNTQTGEINTICGFLWETQDNMMELLSYKYDFVDRIEDAKKEYYSDKKQTLSDRLDDMYIPNGVKRPIYRTLAIVDDVVKANGKVAPKKIFIEMARGGGEKDKRTKSRYEQLIDLYKEVSNEDVRIVQQQLEAMGDSANTKLQSDKLFLYYLQLGKCMYTGEPIDDISKLSDESLYNVDHIYPQALVKDDSILNNKVLVKSQVNGAKSDVYPIDPEIQNRMRGYWKNLCDKKLITEEKYRRLVRTTPFSNDEKWGFINRQLVETRQTTKEVAQILKDKYPD